MKIHYTPPRRPGSSAEGDRPDLVREFYSTGRTGSVEFSDTHGRHHPPVHHRQAAGIPTQFGPVQFRVYPLWDAYATGTGGVKSSQVVGLRDSARGDHPAGP